MCIFQGIICDKVLSREQFASMTELQSKQILDQHRTISEKDSEIFNLKRDLEMQRERYDADLSELKEKIESLEWKKTREIYKGSERSSDKFSR